MFPIFCRYFPDIDMAYTVLQRKKKHDGFCRDLDKEIIQARNMLNKLIEEVCMSEHSKLFLK